jgi:hypothetical protein
LLGISLQGLEFEVQAANQKFTSPVSPFSISRSNSSDVLW